LLRAVSYVIDVLRKTLWARYGRRLRHITLCRAGASFTGRPGGSRSGGFTRHVAPIVTHKAIVNANFVLTGADHRRFGTTGTHLHGIRLRPHYWLTTGV